MYGTIHLRRRQIFTISDPSTVCWIEVKVAVLCAHQHMPWNPLLIKVLHNFSYFKHQIPTRTSSEEYLWHYWRNFLQKMYFFSFFKDNFFNCVPNTYASEQIIVKIECSKYQKLFKTLITNIFQDIFCHAHKTATLTPIYHTVPSPNYIR